MSVRREIASEHHARCRPRPETGQPPGSARADQERGQAEAADYACDLSGHFVTTTTALATWPCVATRRT